MLLYVNSLHIVSVLMGSWQNQTATEMITITIVLVILLIKRLVSYFLTIPK
jgi:hypothetical protein